MRKHFIGTRHNAGCARALLPAVIALVLAACGGGGGGVVRSDPPPSTPGTPPPPVPNFTPNVANDAALVVNPPNIPTLGAPRLLPQYSQHLALTNAAGALGAGLTGQGVTIGLLDTGVNGNHPALQGRVTAHFTHVDPATNDTSVDDVVGHGTVVAEMAAGQAMGNWGGGVAQSANIVVSRIIDDHPPPDDGSGEGTEIHPGDGFGDFFIAVNAELADAGAKILNNSWGGVYWTDPAVTAELDAAWRQFVIGRGGLIVFANGNSGEDPRFAGEPSDIARLPTLANDPALEKGWITVGALDPNNPTQLTSYSQQCGSAMNYCMVAPGNVVFIDPKAKVGDSSYNLYQGGGTSYAAPQVAGAAAVVWSAFPYFSNDQVRQTVLAASKDLGAPGVDPVFGWGLLDVTKAAMGPSNFAWGDFSVTFTGNSVWRNVIVGSGGLIKGGSGILTLAEAGKFTGATKVNAGGLDVRKGLLSDLTIASGATVWGSGSFGGFVNNSGHFLSGASSPASIAGNFTQSASGNLGVWLGSALNITGSATLAGTLSILGVRSGYTTQARETLLNANGGISGTFSSLKAAPNVFLIASLAYDPNKVYLDISRIDVSKAVAGMGLSGASAETAVRVESAMQALDALGGRAGGGVSAGFIGAAGAFQQAGSAAQADLSLRSLSGEMHAASAALTFDAIDRGRRTLVQRLDGLARRPARAGGWYRDLASGGQFAPAGYDRIGVASSGSMIGNDWRAGHDAVLGVAMNRLEQSSWLGALGDSSHGYQSEVQLYAATWRGPWQAQAQLTAGTFQRQLQRNLLLGSLQEAVAARLSGRYQSLSVELGRRVEMGGFTLMPYLGSSYVHLANDGFDEGGQTGFGLRAHAWDASRWQALAGLRAERGWRVGDVDLRADAYAEWQQTLAMNGLLFDASFTGIEQWAPLQGMALSRRGQQLGLGLSALFGQKAMLRFDLSQRRSDTGRAGTAMLWVVIRDW
ncbi:MAG: S8 family serine peptidase [Thermomonas sp.]|uniref:autotransporter serine protease n=1 Tax=Thermomonas sp. TaxID=1971895 RepID=UPI001DDF2FFB|nr:autotransporter serine protease [Thermomonas sp.]MBZ0088652.1 S8 family serine peptidase [Thermomonas sp.]